MQFQDRYEAGRMLAAKLVAYADRPDVLVLASSRGGMPVAFEIAQALRAPLDIFLVRQLGVPGHEELAMGAVTTGGVCVLDPDVVNYLAIPRKVIDRAAADERPELERRERIYRGSRPAPEVGGRTVILVDDGLAAGSTLRTAAAALRQQQPARLIVAVPVAAASTCSEFRALVDEIVCFAATDPFSTVGLWYEDFSQATDEEVCDLLVQIAHLPECSGDKAWVRVGRRVFHHSHLS